MESFDVLVLPASKCRADQVVLVSHEHRLCTLFGCYAAHRKVAMVLRAICRNAVLYCVKCLYSPSGGCYCTSSSRAVPGSASAVPAVQRHVRLTERPKSIDR
nr:hypothetical protein CFP56_11491 [Quercus suber]